MFGPNVKNAKRYEFPFIVALTKLNYELDDASYYHICTGALITRQDVLIAAHCFEDEIASETEVRVGSIDLTRSTRYAPLWWVSFNEWAPRMHRGHTFPVNDIGNIRVNNSPRTPLLLTSAIIVDEHRASALFRIITLPSIIVKAASIRPSEFALGSLVK